jgi:hypothetical protein
VRPRDRWRIVRQSPYIPFPHGSIMFRRTAFDAVGGYAPGEEGVEDQELAHRMRSRGRIVTLPDVLHGYRYHAQNSSIDFDDRVDAKYDRSAPSTWRASRYYRRGAMRLWAGASPDVFQDVVHPAARSWHPRYAVILTWAAWAAVHPASLRGFIRILTVLRDRVCGLWIRDGVAYEWRSGRS